MYLASRREQGTPLQRAISTRGKSTFNRKNNSMLTAKLLDRKNPTPVREPASISNPKPGRFIVPRSLKHVQIMNEMNLLLRLKGSASVQENPSLIRNNGELMRRHLSETFASLSALKSLPTIESSVLREKRVTLPKPKGKSKTFIFDLDETLVHCVKDPCAKAQKTLLIPLEDGETVVARLNIRPHARACLAKASQQHEVIVFTASEQSYADAVIDLLDPTQEFIHHRLYRQHCIQIQGAYIKDLRILFGRKIQDIVIFDNSLHSFAYQLDNGVPILSWYDDCFDSELSKLMNYFPVLSAASDIRDVNRQAINLQQFFAEFPKYN